MDSWAVYWTMVWWRALGEHESGHWQGNKFIAVLSRLILHLFLSIVEARLVHSGLAIAKDNMVSVAYCYVLCWCGAVMFIVNRTTVFFLIITSQLLSVVGK